MKELRFALMDEKRYVFPFYCDSSGRTHIMNSSEHCLIDEIRLLRDMGIEWFLIDARNRGSAYVFEMTSLWVRVIKEIYPSCYEESVMIKNKVHSMSYGGITRSGFRRGLSGKIKI
jgi:collagenase-like PrtC family protease